MMLFSPEQFLRHEAPGRTEYHDELRLDRAFERFSDSRPGIG
jgi:hypothetical protein